ncbi:hypothetical protein BC827DRAFT_1263782 [Russula dissimulans]|nr:hypothetical protein BC827DRAFT_1263782 [Russula dissimulans]
MPQQGPPPQQVQTGSSTPMYQQPQPQNAGSTSLPTGVNDASAPGLHQSAVGQHSGVTAPTGFAEAVPVTPASVQPGNHVLDGSSPDFTFGVTEQPGEQMDFTFDTITSTPGDDGLLAAMQAIQDPSWWQNYMMPGFFWPEESIQDHAGGVVGNGMSEDN